MINDTLADQLQIWGFESDCIVFNDGSLGFGLELIPIDVTCWKDESVNSFIDRTMQVLNGLPAHTDLQFIQEIGAGNAKLVAAHRDLIDPRADLAAQTLCDARTNRILKMDKEGLIPRHTLKLFVRRPMATPLIDKKSILNALWAKPKLFPSITEEALRREVSAISIFRSELSQNLRSLGISTQVLGSDQIVNLLYRQWNPSRNIDVA